MPRKYTITTIYRSTTLFLFLTAGSFESVAAVSTPSPSPALTTHNERIAKTADVDVAQEKNIKAAPLVTFETISARSGELLKPYLSKATSLKDSLQKAMESTYKANPDILTQRAAVRSADEDVVQAKAGWRPSINATITNGYENQRFSGDSVDAAAATGGSNASTLSEGHLQTAQLTVSQNLFNGGATVAQTEGAKAGIKSQRAALIETEQNTLLAAIQAYLDLITQLAQLEVLRANEGFLKVTLQSTQDKFNVGEETRTSVAQAEAQHAEAIAKRQTAEAQLGAKIATYEQVVGRMPGNLEKPTLPKWMPKNIKDALDKARLNNPTILKAQYAEVAARRKVEQVNGGLLPKVDLQGSSNLTQARVRKTNVSATGIAPGTTSDFTVDHKVTVNITIPVYEAGSIRSQKRQAIEDAERNRIQIEVARRQIEQQLIQAFQDYEAAKSNLKYYAEQVRASEISVEGTRQEMLVGSKILLDVLNAQNQLLNAQQALVQVEQNLYAAAYKIIVLMGMLTAKSMQLQVDHYDATAHYKEIKNNL